MKNFRCTFTGVDEATSLQEIERISHVYPFVEWGVLLSTSESKSFNGNRYPTLDWLFINMPKLKDITKITNCSIALHVCGKETKLLLSQSEDSIALKLLPYVNRVQINFSYKGYVQNLVGKCFLKKLFYFHKKNKSSIFKAFKDF